jgi:catechol 2,3-dioxygenase
MDAKRGPGPAIATDRLHPDVRIGHVRLHVTDLPRTTAFYRDVLGFDVTAYGPDHRGAPQALLSAGGYHHHIALTTCDDRDAPAPPSGRARVAEIALLFPSRIELARTVRRCSRTVADSTR